MDESSDSTENEDGGNQLCLLNDEISQKFSFSRTGDIVSMKFEPNSIHSFPYKKFLSCSDLTYLSLPNNNLTTLNEEIFSMFPWLTWLDVRNNRIEEFPKVNPHESMEQLLIGGNKIEQLPIEIGSFPRLYALQVTGNPLIFPNLKEIEASEYNIVEYLKLCWKQQSKTPQLKLKPENKGPVAAKKKIIVKKEECMAPVQQFKHVANVVADKIKSADPVDQILANNIVKKLRAIENDLQKAKDQETLKEWREKYTTASSIKPNKPTKPAPYGIDPDFMSMMTRRDLLNNQDLSKKENKIIRKEKRELNLNEELMKVNKELDTIKARKPALDPAAEKLQRMVDIQKMNNIQRKIKDLQLANIKSLM